VTSATEGDARVERSFAARMNDETSFVPRGAVAFFAAMMVFYVAVWALLAAIMVARG